MKPARVVISWRARDMGGGKLKCPQCGEVKSARPHFVSFLKGRAKKGQLDPEGRIVHRCADCRRRSAQWSTLSAAERMDRTKKREREGTGYRVRFITRSNNRKLGPIPVSMTDMASCPPACSFRGAGCYAEFMPLRRWWDDAARNGMPWSAFVAWIADLPAGTVWRHNEAGDLPGLGDHLDVKALDALVDANRGKRGFTFTHKPLRWAGEELAIRRANRAGFTINLSADSLAEADRWMAKGLGPVVVVLPHQATARPTKTPAGHTVIVCPAETHEITCEKCQLCAKPQRKAIVSFRAHGQSRYLISELVLTKRRKKPTGVDGASSVPWLALGALCTSKAYAHRALRDRALRVVSIRKSKACHSGVLVGLQPATGAPFKHPLEHDMGHLHPYRVATMEIDGVEVAHEVARIDTLGPKAAEGRRRGLTVLGPHDPPPVRFEEVSLTMSVPLSALREVPALGGTVPLALRDPACEDCATEASIDRPAGTTTLPHRGCKHHDRTEPLRVEPTRPIPGPFGG